MKNAVEGFQTVPKDDFGAMNILRRKIDLNVVAQNLANHAENAAISKRLFP